ncbi:YtxH domain-containing protein [Maridesulfovibrio sp. FT414]|uniref:YtxH domain-containing protein n=1 Tax=Maridesulfovibrio sp. FT414 TaxID=2979469 RepID=UPI003D804E98
MTWLKRFVYVLCLVAVMAVVSGCDDAEGPAEKLGKQIDQAMDSAKDKMDEMGDKAKDAYEDAKDKAKEAMDK